MIDYSNDTRTLADLIAEAHQQAEDRKAKEAALETERQDIFDTWKQNVTSMALALIPTAMRDYAEVLLDDHYNKCIQISIPGFAVISRKLHIVDDMNTRKAVGKIELVEFDNYGWEVSKWIANPDYEPGHHLSCAKSGIQTLSEAMELAEHIGDTKAAAIAECNELIAIHEAKKAEEVRPVRQYPYCPMIKSMCKGPECAWWQDIAKACTILMME